MVAQNLSELFGINPYLLGVILIWIVVWKGLALWKAARKGSGVWFIVLLVINTMGILEMLYIYIFSEIKLGDGKMGKTKVNKVKKKNVSA